MIGISYIITTYNRPESLLKAIDSVTAERILPSELIIIDDCGTEIVEMPLDKQKQWQGNMHLIRNEQNKGVILSRNVGIEVAKYDYILFLDDDDISFPNRSKDLLPYIVNNDYAFVAGKCEMTVNASKNIIPDAPQSELSPILLLSALPHINSVLWQKSKLTALGGLDNRVPYLGEHVTMQLLLLRGYKGIQVNNVVASFKSTDDGLTAKVVNDNKIVREFMAFYDALLSDMGDSSLYAIYKEISHSLREKTVASADDYIDFVRLKTIKVTT